MKRNVSLFEYMLGLLLIVSIILWLFFPRCKEDTDSIPETPITTKVDTLYITNTEIKYKIRKIDSIKYDTIQKIYNLNDSATVKLFYELCSK